MNDCRNAKILIVEDETAQAFEVKEILESNGYEIVGIAASQSRAIEIVNANPPDLILLDIRLKGGDDGIETARILREMCDAAIVYLSAFVDNETVDRAKATAPYGYIPKPINETLLRITVTLALSNHRHSRESQTRPQSRIRDKVFISYCHRDLQYLTELSFHLKPLRRSGIDIWDDERLKPGTRWKEEIQKALGQARIGVLLVTAHFLASEFIVKNELPPILKAAEKEGALIFYLIVRPCRIPESLAVFQAINTPSKAMSEMTEPERDRIWMILADHIERNIDPAAAESES